MNNNTPINNYQKTLAIIWSWDHELSQKDIADQLQQFADCGVSQVMIEWAPGTYAFWSEKWHHSFQAALAKAHTLGMRIVLRDSNLHTDAPEPCQVENAGVARYLNYKLIVVGKGERIVAPLPDGELVGARAYRLENGQISTDHSICLDDQIKSSIIDWECSFELALVTLFCSTPDGVCSCNQFIFDDFRLHCLEAKLADIQRRYHNWLGGTLSGIALTVAACQHTLMWTTQFPEQFSNRTGYSLIDHMALLVVDGNSCETVRRDYHDVAGDLIIENFLEPSRKWIHSTGLRLYGGLSWEENGDTLDSLSLNRMRLLRHVDSALVEQVSEQRNLLSLAMARLVHKDDVHQMEAVLRGILSQPIDEVTRRVEEAVKLGADIVWLDTVESSRPKSAVNIIKKLLGNGASEPSQQPSEAGVGIYHPCKTLAAYTALSGKLKGLEENPSFMADGERARRMTIQLEQLCEMLDRRQVQLNVLDTVSLCGMQVNNEGALQARLGGPSFHSIILPGVLVISLPELLLLEEFVSRGGHLVAWGSLPTHSSDEAERKRLSECCERLFGHSVNPKQMNQNPYGEGMAVFIPFEPGTEIACIENIIDLVI